MIGADSSTGIAVEIFMEEHKVFPVGIGLKRIELSGDGPSPGRVPKKDPVETPGNFARDFRQVFVLPAAARELHLELWSQVVMKLLQRFDEKEVQGEPNRAAPIGVSAEQAGLRFGRLIIHAVFVSIDVKNVRIFSMESRQGADAI